MLTVNQFPSSLPRSQPHFRRTLPPHLSQHHHRRRSLSHPAPSDAQDGSRPAATLRSHAEAEDEGADEDEDEDEEEIAVQAESRERLSAFVLKETSGESSDEDEDELDEDDEDSSSSVSSSGSTPQLKPADSTTNSVGKRSVTFHSSIPHLPTTTLPPSAVPSVVHRKLVKPSIRQHKASPHHYSSSHPNGSKAHAVRLHRRKPHTVESNLISLSDDIQQSGQSALVSKPTDSNVAVSPTVATVMDVGAAVDKRAPLVPPSSVSRYALLVAILRRSGGRDKLIRTAYFGSNHMRALVHAIHSQLSGNKRLLSMLSIPSSSTSPVLIRLLSAAASFCQRADTHLGRLSEVLGAARQLLRLGLWVNDLQSLSEAWQEWKKCSSVEDGCSNDRRIEQATAMLELINAFLSVVIDLMDDIEWLAEHRVLPSALSSPAGFASAILWLTSVCIDIPFTLHTLSVISQSPGREDERRAEQLSLLRYAGDLLYSGSLVADHVGWLGEAAEGARWRVGDSGGLLSAVVSLYKLSRSETLHRSVH